MKILVNFEFYRNRITERGYQYETLKIGDSKQVTFDTRKIRITVIQEVGYLSLDVLHCLFSLLAKLKHQAINLIGTKY